MLTADISNQIVNNAPFREADNQSPDGNHQKRLNLEPELPPALSLDNNQCNDLDDTLIIADEGGDNESIEGHNDEVTEEDNDPRTEGDNDQRTEDVQSAKTNKADGGDGVSKSPEALQVNPMAVSSSKFSDTGHSGQRENPQILLGKF